MDYKSALLDALQTLKKRELAQKAPFKARAYDTVLRQLEQLPGPILALTDLHGIKGMGEKIREKVEEIFATGRLRAAEQAKANPALSAHETLQGVYGVGPAKAAELIQQGITSIAALREALKETPSLLHDKQRIGLHYYEDLLQRIPRNEMAEHERLLLQDSPFASELVGSYRRGAQTSGDIDVLLRVERHQTEEDAKSMFDSFVQRLVHKGYIKAVLALGDHKCMAICSLGPDTPARRLDLLLTPYKEYPFALLYFTGSDRFNVAVRQRALERGYTLNEHRLTSLKASANPAPPIFCVEQDIFHFLDLAYVSPSQRMDVTSLTELHPLLPPASSPSSPSSPSLPASPSSGLRMRRPVAAKAPSPTPSKA